MNGSASPMRSHSQSDFCWRSFTRFLLPSLLGILVFLTPLRTDGGFNTGLGLLTDWAKAMADSYLPGLVVATVCISAFLSLWGIVLRPRWARDPIGLARAFSVSGWAAMVRTVGAALVCMVFFEVGPEWIGSSATGGIILSDLMTVIFVVFLFASVLLPLLTDYGLMEFIGSLMHRLFRPLFRLPGRAAVDSAASWFGSSVVGLVITTQQFEKGHYTEREALIIALNFSVVSVAFARVIIDFAGLGNYFFPFYGAVVVSGFVAAIILPRLPPLTRKSERFVPAEDGSLRSAGSDVEAKRDGSRPGGVLAQGLKLATAGAAKAPALPVMLRRSVRMAFDIWFGLLPVVMVVGTFALALANYTPIIEWLSYPFVPFAELLRLPEAAAVAPAILSGFADQFLPVILAQEIQSDLTRFVIACTAVTQLVYMSEVGAVLLKSRLPITALELFLVFLLRTLITVPICAGIGHLVF